MPSPATPGPSHASAVHRRSSSPITAGISLALSVLPYLGVLWSTASVIISYAYSEEKQASSFLARIPPGPPPALSLVFGSISIASKFFGAIGRFSRLPEALTTALVVLYLVKFALVDPWNAVAAQLSTVSCAWTGRYCIQDASATSTSNTAKLISAAWTKEAQAIRSFAEEMITLAQSSAVEALGVHAENIDKIQVDLAYVITPDSHALADLVCDAHDSIWDLQKITARLKHEGVNAVIFFIREYRILAEQLKLVQARPRRHEWQALVRALDRAVVRFEATIKNFSPVVDSAINISTAATDNTTALQRVLDEQHVSLAQLRSRVLAEPLKSYLCILWAPCWYAERSIKNILLSRTTVMKIRDDLNNVQLAIGDIGQGVKTLLDNLRVLEESPKLGPIPDLKNFYDLVVGLDGLEQDIQKIQGRRHQPLT